MQWAILSGIEGNLAAYEAVLKDLRRQPVTDLYVLGDVIGLKGDNVTSDNQSDNQNDNQSDNEAVIRRLRHPSTGEYILAGRRHRNVALASIALMD